MPRGRPVRCTSVPATKHGEPLVIMSTGSISAPFSFVISPNCFVFGNLRFVTSMGNVSISLDHIGFIPARTAASCQPPISRQINFQVLKFLTLGITSLSTYPAIVLIKSFDLVEQHSVIYPSLQISNLLRCILFVENHDVWRESVIP